MLVSHELLTALVRATFFTSVAVALVWLLNASLRTASPRFQRVAWAIAIAQSWLLFPWTLRIEMESEAQPITMMHVATITVNELESIKPVQIVDDSEEAAASTGLFTWKNLATAMLAAWAGGAGLLVLSRAARYARFVRQLPLANSLSPIDPWRVEWQHQLAAARIRRRAELRMTCDTGPLVCYVPFLYLVLAPRILWQSLSGSEREAILRHELAHLQRGDIWKSLAIRLLALPQWFNPLIWRAVRSFDEAGEWACDDRVARAGRGSQLQLAKSLVRAAEFVTAGVPAAASAQGGVLSRRIRRLVTPQIQEESTMKKIMLVLLLVALAAVQSVRIEHVAAAPQTVAPPTAYEEKLLGIVQPWSLRLGAYVIEPPDLVRLSVGQLTPKPDYKISISDAMHVIGLEESNGIPVVHTFEVNSKGDVELGAEYGAVQVVGRTQADAQTAIADRVNSRRPESERRRVTASVNYPIGVQRIFAGEKLVSPDGNINLGKYGKIYIAGKTVLGARNSIQTHLEEFFVEPQINLEVTGYNSKVFYVVPEGPGLDETILRVPATGNETVHDAIANVAKRPPTARIWVARPNPAGDAEQNLPVNWSEIRSGGSTATNYQLLPGDRVYISTKPNAPAGSNDAADEKRPSGLDRYTYPPDGKNDPTADPRGVMIHLKGGPGNGVQMMLETPAKDATVDSVISSIKAWPHPVSLDRATITVRRYDADGIEQKLPVVWDSAKDRPSSETNHAIRPSDQIEILERSLASPSVARMSNPPVPADRPQAIVHAALPAGAPLPPPPPAIVATDQGDGKILPIQLVAAENGATVVTAMAQVKRWLVAESLAKSPIVLQRRNQDGAMTKELPIVWNAKTHEPTPDSNYTLEPGDMILIGNPQPMSADDSADRPIKPTVKYPPPYDRPVIVQLKSGNGKPRNAAELVPLEGETVSGMLGRINVWPNPVSFASSDISVLRFDDDGVRHIHPVTWDVATRKPTPETDHALRSGDAIVIVEVTRSAPAPGGMYGHRPLANDRALPIPPSATAVSATASPHVQPANMPDPTEGKTFIQYRAMILQDTSGSLSEFMTDKTDDRRLSMGVDTAAIDATMRILMNNKLIAFMSRPQFIAVAGQPNKLSIGQLRADGQIDGIEAEFEVFEAKDRISTRVVCTVKEFGRTAQLETVVEAVDGKSVILEFARPKLPPDTDAGDEKRIAAKPIYLVLTPVEIRRAPAASTAK